MNYLVLVQNLNSASGICVKRIASEFRKNGSKLWIITESLVQDNDEFVISIGNTPFGINKFFKNLHRIRTLLLYPIWPRQRLFFYNKLYREAERIIRIHKIDALICVYNSVESLMVGHMMKKKHPRLLYIPYFLDALYGGQKPYFMPERIKKRKALRIESRLLNNADRVIMMEPAQKAYDRDGVSPDYLKKTIFLDIPLFNPVMYSVRKRKYFSSNTINIFYCGSMPNNIRNPKVFIDIFSKIDSDKYHLYFAGSTDYEKLLSEAAANCNRIHLLGIIDHSMAEDMMKEADFLLNIGNSLSYMVPSKIFEYISYGKRIISTYRIDDDPCIPYLKKYPSSLLINEHEDCALSARRIVEFFESSPNSCELDQAKFYKNTPIALYNSVNTLFDNR